MAAYQDCRDAISRLATEEKGIRAGLAETVPDLENAALSLAEADILVKSMEAKPASNTKDREQLSEARTQLMNARCEHDQLYRMQNERTQRLEDIQNDRSNWMQRLNNLKSPEGQGV